MSLPIIGASYFTVRFIKIYRMLHKIEFLLFHCHQESTELQTLVRYLWALSLVPESAIISTWEGFISVKYEEMRDNLGDAGENVDEFLSYFEKTWIGALNWRTGARRAPMFPHSMWNKFQTVMSDDIMTSNAAEGYNRALSLSFPKNASIWTVIQQLRSEENNNFRKMKDVALGLQNNCSVAPGNSRNIQKLQKRSDLKKIVSNFENVELHHYMDLLIDFFNN